MLGAAPAAEAAPFDQVTGIMVPAPSVDAQTGKLHTGTASACSPAKVVPPVDPGTFNFVGFSEPSTINEPACVTVTITTTDSTCWTNGLFSASYLGSFDNTNVQTNYVGDVGAGPTSATPVAYSMVVPPGQVLDTLFNTSSPGTGCPSFDVTWSSDRPWAVSRPRISGHPFAGETVTAVDGVWSAGTLTRQWRRCALDGSSCADIPGATGTTYAVAPDDVGHALVLHVAATDSGMTSTSDGRPVVAGVQFDALNGQSISGTEPTQQGRLALNPVPSTCASPRAAGNAVDTAHTRSYDVFTHTNQSESTLCTIASLDTTTACTGSGGATSAAYLPTYQPGAVRTNYLGDTG